ncbi:GNAT family N-acetyltransferase [Catellatospora bangladeshensis]|uniref:N-acetyltransferase n=1 Tax=Catellatospora bangladeshensis TaxID=310355 RepID=A0A8J3NLT1_9ACTN|nr:GNAT family N-acetyltransferase [Catellatospora bangladeshensis]GIF85392.1 N-acetyltransferase [Catellatospora bangladeshensis]
MTITVRRLAGDDWQTLRELRLNALQEAPYAFGSTFERERDRTEQEWRARLDNPASASFAALLDGVPAGLAGGYLPEGEQDAAELFSMWVSPAARGRRIAEQLVGAVAGWARDLGRAEVVLEVTAGNDTAARVYERCGFAPRAGVPHTPGGALMRLPLG